MTVIIVECINVTIEIKWLRLFLKTDSFMFNIINWIFKKPWVTSFLLRCDCDRKRQRLISFIIIILKLSTSNFSPHNPPLWNSRYVVFRNKDLLLNKNRIWYMMHLLNDTGNITPYRTFCSKSNNQNQGLQDLIVLSPFPYVTKCKVTASWDSGECTSN